jgi:hypothetical protein
MLCRLSGLGLLQGLPLLKFESDLICATYHHDKMIAASYSPVNTVMTEHPGQLLHIDTVGPSRVRSMGGKWYVLVIVDDYSCYSCVFFLGRKDVDFAGCGINRNNTSGTCHFFGSSLVCWSSQKQSLVPRPTTETEYIAAARRFFG